MEPFFRSHRTSRWALALSSLAAGLAGCGAPGTEAKPCKPGCVDGHTRLECDANGAPHAVECTAAHASCAEAVCQAGECTVQPAEGAACGVTGEGTCNAGYACLGADVQLTAIRQHTCAVASDGNVWCWGNNARGELGDGTQTDRGNPVLVRSLPAAASGAAAGYAHTCALVNGTAFCWGDNTVGQAAPDIQDNPVLDPRPVESPVNFVSLVAGQGHTCGVTPEAEVYCWGNTSAGQCGIDPKDAFNVGPSKIPGLDHVKSLETVKNHLCAVRTEDPTLVCWGSNQYLEDGGYEDFKLGPGTLSLPYSATPRPVDVGTRVVDVGMGFESSYAVGADGKIYAWGYNGSGQLGNGNKDENAVETPSPVLMAAGTPLIGAVDVLRSDGSDQCAEVNSPDASSYWCWGKDDSGELAMEVAGSQWFVFAQKTIRLPEGASHLVRGEDHGCFTLLVDGKTEIQCYGKTLMVGSGSVEVNAKQQDPKSVVWDPKNYTALGE